LDKWAKNYPWVYWPALGFLSIFVVGLIVRWADNGCFPNGAVCFDYAWSRFQQIVTFAWVPEHQTLIGGGLAFGAGSFVYFASREQRVHETAARGQRTRKKNIATLQTCRIKILSLLIAKHKALEDELGRIDPILTLVTEIDPHLSHFIFTNIEKYRIEKIRGETYVEHLVIPALFLIDCERLIDKNGQYVHRKQELSLFPNSGYDFASIMASKRVSGMASYFNL
jgi:hypothetical protein